MKPSLCMIVRNNEKTIHVCLKSALPFVGELVVVDTGSTDETVRCIEVLCAEYEVPCKVLHYKDPHEHERWISNFSIPRQLGWDACSGDMILWLDSDDELMGGKEMCDFLEDHCSGEPSDIRMDAIEMRYDYQHNALGECTVRQRRHRIVRPGHFRWDYPVHELLHPTRPGVETREGYALPFWVKHHGTVTEEGRQDSAERNLWIIERWQDDELEMSPRLWRGKADAFRSLGRHAEAVASMTMCLNESGDPDERYLMYVRRGDSNRSLGNTDMAMDDYARAERMKPHYRHAYMAMAEILLEHHHYEQAIVWCDKIEMAGGDEKALSFNPTAGNNVPMFVRTMSYFALEKYEEAAHFSAKLVEIAPNNPIAIALNEKAGHAVKCREMFNAYAMLHDELGDDEEKKERLRTCVPEILKAFPGFSDITAPPRPDDRETIAIYCHRTVNVWGPGGLEKGVGGSEEAVIHMSRGLVTAGYHVEVYGTPPVDEIGVDDFGVVWLPFHAWTDKSTPDIFIAWRDTRYMTLGLGAKQRYLWLQDIPRPEWYTEEFVDSINGILCISELQASYLPQHAQEKVIITGNGISPSECVDGPNERHRFIYCSSPDRGLLELLKDGWPLIKKAIPDAELDVFYGFRDVYTANLDGNSQWSILKDEIEKLAKQDGVVWHGMVGVTELHKAMANTGFWLYPTSFEESYCTNAAKVQAMGCIPVTSRHTQSSLPEVCGNYDLGPLPREGKKIEDDSVWLNEWVERVIELASKPDQELDQHRASMKEYARNHLTWQRRAEQWEDLFQKAVVVSTSPSSEPEPAPAV